MAKKSFIHVYRPRLCAAAVSFYDDHHRVMQTRRIDYKGQIAVQVAQYNFRGNLLRVFVQLDNMGSATDEQNVMTRIAVLNELNKKNKDNNE